MGIHDVDRVELLAGMALDDVTYLWTDGTREIEQWQGYDLVETVLLTVGGQPFTLWVSGGAIDTVAIAGDYAEIRGTQFSDMSASERKAAGFVEMPASEREPWRQVIGRRVHEVRFSYLEDKPRRPLVRAIELAFEGSRSITVAGYRPSNGFATTSFDDLAVLTGGISAFADLSSTKT